MKKKMLLIAAATLALTSSVAISTASAKAPLVLDKVSPETQTVMPMSVIAPESVSLAVPLYSQSGQTWSSTIMSTCGSSIGSAGCTLTSAAMVFKYYGVSIDPGSMNAKMGSSACPFVYGDAITKAGAGIVNHVTTSSPTAWSTVYSAANSALAAGHPYIVGMNKNAGGTHFVVIVGVTNSGTTGSDFTINDPAGGVKRSLSYYTSSATPYRGVVYSK